MNCSHHLLRNATALALVFGIASAPLVARADAPPVTSAPVPDYVDVEVADSVLEVELVKSWTNEAIGAGLEDAKINKAESGRTLSVSIGGAPFAYEVTIGVKQRAEWIGDLRTGKCKCDDAQLVERVRSDVAAVAGRLSPSSEPTTAVMPPDVPPDDPALTNGDRNRVPLGGKGKAGVALLVVGTGAVIAGAVVLAMKSGEDRDQGNATQLARRDRRPAGAAVLAVGGVVVIVGAVLLGLDRRDAKRNKRISVSPAAGGASLGFVLSGSF